MDNSGGLQNVWLTSQKAAFMNIISTCKRYCVRFNCQISDLLKHFMFNLWYLFRWYDEGMLNLFYFDVKKMEFLILFPVLHSTWDWNVNLSQVLKQSIISFRNRSNRMDKCSCRMSLRLQGANHATNFLNLNEFYQTWPFTLLQVGFGGSQGLLLF